MFLGSTDVPASRSIAEIQGILAKVGAGEILQELKGGQCVGIQFSLQIHGQRVGFALPARVDAIYRKLQSQRRPQGPRSEKAGQERDAKQAPMIAWRQLVMWLKAQLALIDTEQVDAGEVFLPYQMTASGDTVYERIKALGQHRLQLPALPAGPTDGR